MGNDGGTPEYQKPGKLSTQESVPDFSTSLNSYLATASVTSKDQYGNWMVEVPIDISSSTTGMLEIFDLSIEYNYSVTIDFKNALQSLIPPTGTGNVTIVIAVSSQTAGIIALTNLFVDFTPPNLAPSVNPIPDTYNLEEGTVVDQLLDISYYFYDDHQAEWDLVYTVENYTHKDKVKCSIDSLLFLKVDATVDPDWFGDFQVSMRAKDAQGKSTVSNKFNISVTPVNDPPVITNEPLKNATEDQAYAFKFNATDADGDTLTWSLGGATVSWLALGSDTGILSGFPLNEHVGSHKVMVNVSDGNGGQDNLVYTLAVANVNDAPQVVTTLTELRILEDGSLNIDLNEWFLDVDSSLQFRCEGQANITVTVHENGTADLVPASNWHGAENHTFYADDGEAEIPHPVLVRVSSVNDAPQNVTITLDDFKYVVGGDQPAWGTAFDGDLAYGDTLNFSWSSNASGHIAYGTEVNLTLAPGLHTITLLVKDSTGLTGSGTEKINIFPLPYVPPDNNVTDDDTNETDDDGQDDDLGFPTYYLYILVGIIVALVLILIIAAVFSRKGGPEEVPKEPEMLDAEIGTDDVFKKKEEDVSIPGETDPLAAAMPEMAEEPDLAAPEMEPVDEGPTFETLVFDEDRMMTIWDEGLQMPLPAPKVFEADFDEGQSLDELFIFNHVGKILYHYVYEATSVKDNELLASIVTVLMENLRGEIIWKDSSFTEIAVGKMSVLILTGKYIGAVGVTTSGPASYFEKSVNRFVHEVESANEDLFFEEEDEEDESGDATPTETKGRKSPGGAKDHKPPESLIGVKECISKLVHRGY
jgi:hypothetical protein